MPYTISIHATGGTFGSTVHGGMLDFTGDTFTGGVDVSGTRNSAGIDSTPFTTSITTTQNNDVIVGVMTVDSGIQVMSASPTSNPVMTLENTTDANLYIDEMGIWTSHGAKAIGFTNSGQTYQLCRIVAGFKTAAGTATFSQKARLSGTLTAGTLTATVTQPANGDLVIIGMSYGSTVNSNPTSRSITDSLGNTFTELVNVFNSSGFISLSLFYCLNFGSSAAAVQRELLLLGVGK